jgi:hypothetical protein
MDRKRLLAVAVPMMALAGCATVQDPTPLARADCRIAPVTTASATGARPRRADPLDQRYAEMQLATSDYRMRRLQQPLGATSNVEDALRDCDNADMPAVAPPAPEAPAVAPAPVTPAPR